MRVAIIGDYPLDTSQVRGGVQAAFAYLVKGLSQIDDIELHLLTLRPRGWTGPNQVRNNSVTLHLLSPFRRFEFVRNYRTYQAHLNEKLTRIQPDVIHAQDAAADAYVALRSGYPTVITVHGVWRENSKYIDSFYRRVRHYMHSWLIERYNLKHTYHLIAISRYVTNYFSELLRPEAQVYYVPNAIDSAFFNPANSSNGQTILFAGRVIQRKRPLDLIQAFAKIARQIPSAQLRIAGEYSSEKAYAETIQDYIQQEKLKERVHLLGPLAEEVILQEFASCNVLALPSAQETTPMVIAQAMAAGKPVVATPVGGVAEMVNHGETGFLVEVGDVDTLASSLLSLLQDTSLRIRVGQLGHNFAVEHYRADNVAWRTYKIYQRIVAAGS